MWSSSPPSNPRTWALLLAWTLALCCLGACADCSEDEPEPAQVGPFAALEKPVGTVGYRRGVQWFKGSEGASLEPNDAVRTGHKSETHVAFRDGARVKLAADTLLELSQVSDGIVLQLGAGEVEIHIETPAMMFQVSLGDDERRITFHLGTMRVRRGEDTVEVRMVAGEAKVETATGVEIVESGSDVSYRLTTGATIEPDEVAPPEQPTAEKGSEAVPPVPGPVPESPARAVLHDPTRRSQVRGRDERRFKRVKDAETSLEVGTVLKASPKKGPRIETDRGDELQLDKRTVVAIQSLGSGGTYRLESGAVRVRVGSGRRTTVNARGVVIGVEATGFSGSAHVAYVRGETRIRVATGRVTVKIGDEVHNLGAGEGLRIDKTGKTEGPKAAWTTALKAREGRGTRVYYDRRPQSLQLAWAGSGTPQTLEVSTDRSFASVFLREEVKRGSFTLNLAGVTSPFYWRVKRGQGWGAVGDVRLGRDSTLGRGQKRPVKNVVRDTGRETRILFQRRLPALNFRWNKVQAAARYRFKLFKASNLGSPILTREADAPAVTFPSGKLKEGVYYWFATPIDATGRELPASQMNKLTLAFDNATPILRIDRPNQGTRAGGATQVTGVIARGLRLKVNGQAVGKTADGRFSARVKVGADKLLRFQIRGKERDIIFTRHLR